MTPPTTRPMTPPTTQPAAVIGPISEARREMYRQQILAAAEVEFGRAGFADTKVNAIAGTAGLSLATVYKHFAGKNEIWDDLHSERMRQLLEAVDAAPRQGLAPLERLLTGIAEVARFLTDHGPYLEMNLWAGAGWAQHSGRAQGVQGSVWNAGLETITSGVEAALAEGEVVGIRPRVAAGMVVSALQVWLADWVATGRAQDPEEMIAGMVDRLRRLLAEPAAVQRKAASPVRA
ncbi:TetR/AcrR family transcriptional regulator [Nocardioides limicola]|uniref:TetR/AcrR family transcriptional regulator n=1 Tax=Nocardioides limicola TaxID=2803368 RepID=UPI00193C0BA9|nr:TetR/AcrR family transcriptional regulator [Nocardioides sp. DJM-14]